MISLALLSPKSFVHEAENVLHNLVDWVLVLAFLLIY